MYRSIQHALDLIKQTDPQSDLSTYRLRQIAKSGHVKVLSAGSKILFNIKSLSEYLGISITDNK